MSSIASRGDRSEVRSSARVCPQSRGGANHVVALNVGNIITVITRPDAFTDAQWQGARARLLAQGFKILLGPDVSFDTITSTLMSGKADAAFFASLPENIIPSTDDNPFFF